MHDRQSGEFALRAPVVPPLELLRSATFVAARVMGRERQVGAIVPGAWADLLVVDGDPEASLDMLAAPDAGIRVLVQGGLSIKNTLH